LPVPRTVLPFSPIRQRCSEPVAKPCEDDDISRKQAPAQKRDLLLHDAMINVLGRAFAGGARAQVTFD
jgi:hypothetical protein